MGYECEPETRRMDNLQRFGLRPYSVVGGYHLPKRLRPGCARKWVERRKEFRAVGEWRFDRKERIRDEGVRSHRHWEQFQLDSARRRRSSRA